MAGLATKPHHLAEKLSSRPLSGQRPIRAGPGAGAGGMVARQGAASRRTSSASARGAAGLPSDSVAVGRASSRRQPDGLAGFVAVAVVAGPTRASDWRSSSAACARGRRCAAPARALPRSWRGRRGRARSRCLRAGARWSRRRWTAGRPSGACRRSAEELELLLVHVLAVRHGQQFGFAQVAAGLGLPGVGQFGV